MAKRIKIESSSIFNGNPITVGVQPEVITEGTDDMGHPITPSFHRVLLEVECGMSGGNFETIPLFAPVLREVDSADNWVYFDVSSALRSFRDSYHYQPEPCAYPLVKFAVRAYDEYMISGELHQTTATRFPVEKHLSTVFGGRSDWERVTENPAVQHFSRKPNDGAELVAVGDSFVYAEDYDAPRILSTADLPQPSSREIKVTTEGAQILGNRKAFALPASEGAKRAVFRFINGFGVMESVSVPMAWQRTLDMEAKRYVVTRRETLGDFQRLAVNKQLGRERWAFLTDPLTKDWISWYLHELLSSEHVWVQHKGQWIPCVLTADESVTFIDESKREMLSLSFTAELAWRGPLG